VAARAAARVAPRYHLACRGARWRAGWRAWRATAAARFRLWRACPSGS